MKFKIRWGEHRDASSDIEEYESSDIEEYEFQTEAESRAFWLGIQEAEGWTAVAPVL
jgi:hypothetical protein